jgi:hypothetical protein
VFDVTRGMNICEIISITCISLLGDLLNEEEVLKWLIEQKNTATIEEVTDEILEDLIEEYEYVVVYFSKYNSLLNVMILGY